MSTRATITVADQHDSFDLYQHHDGYPDGPHGLVRHIAMARRLAWDLPRFEAADFAAAIIAVLKDRGGSTYLTKDADAHSDRSFHYRIEPVREDTADRVQLTISRPSWERGKGDVEIFAGNIQDAVAKFKAVPDTPDQPREWQMLGEIEGALYRAEEEIGQWVNYTITTETSHTFTVTVKGRDRWMLQQLVTAGENGCTPISHPAPRHSAYVWNLRGLGIPIETITEPHDGPFAGTHARYVLRATVKRLIASEVAN